MVLLSSPLCIQKRERGTKIGHISCCLFNFLLWAVTTVFNSVCFPFIGNTVAGSFFGSLDAARSNLSVKLMQVRLRDFPLLVIFTDMYLKCKWCCIRKEEWGAKLSLHSQQSSLLVMLWYVLKSFDFTSIHNVFRINEPWVWWVNAECSKWVRI